MELGWCWRTGPARCSGDGLVAGRFMSIRRSHPLLPGMSCWSLKLSFALLSVMLLLCWGRQPGQGLLRGVIGGW